MAPPDERGGNRYVQPKATASHSDSTIRVDLSRREPFPVYPLIADMWANADFVGTGQQACAVAILLIYRNVSRRDICDYYKNYRNIETLLLGLERNKTDAVATSPSLARAGLPLIILREPTRRRSRLTRVKSQSWRVR